eukprot:g1625.t1
MSSKKGEGKSSGDERRSFLKKRVMTAFKYASKFDTSKFEKAFGDEKNAKAVERFLEDDHVITLVFNESISASTDMVAASSAGKYVLFVKVPPGNVRDHGVTAKNIRQRVVCSEVVGQPISQLRSLVESIYLPALSNPLNQTGLGDVLSKEILDRFHGFMDSVSITSGHMKGDTLLPLPPPAVMGSPAASASASASANQAEASPRAPRLGAAAAAELDLDLESTASKNRISLLEGTIITWTNQIRDVLQLDPENAFKDGQNPTPGVELTFWANKARHLNFLHSQLRSSALTRVLDLLSRAKSTYCITFTQLCGEVAHARQEANSNVIFLKTIASLVDTMASEENLVKLQESFVPLMHTFLLIWKRSKFYNTPTRLVVLMREVCNALIGQARKFISSEEIFDLIEDENANAGVEKIKTIILVLQNFQSTYFDYKAKAAKECPDNPWRVQNSALFKRLEAFQDRCQDLLELLITIVHFEYLAKIEIGGTKGKTLTSSVKQIYGDFQEAVNTLRESATVKKKYKIMDVSASAFRGDYWKFRATIKQLERRLGSVLTQSMDDCDDNLTNCFKLLNSFDVLLQRRTIYAQMDAHCISLINMFAVDLKVTQEYFFSSHANPPREAFLNLPACISAIHWSRGLRDRIENPMRKLREIDADFSEREEAKAVVEEYFSLCNHLQEYETGMVMEWAAGVEAVSQAKLKLPLLKRDRQTRLLEVNFDAGLVKMLREVKYFLLMGIDVPDSALQIYKKAETFRQHRGNLDMVVDMYNDMLNDLLPVEEPLLRREFDNIDTNIKRAVAEPGSNITPLNWKSGKQISSFVTECMEAVKSCHQIFTKLKTNLKQIKATLDEWRTPLLKRDEVPQELVEFNRVQKTVCAAMYKNIKEGGSKINQLLKDSNSVVKVSSTKDWTTYVEYVGHIVVEGLVTTVCLSLGHLLDQINEHILDDGETATPMIAIELVLHKGASVLFKPTLPDLRSNVLNWMGNCLHFANIIKRLGTEGSYIREMHQDANVLMLLALINERISVTESTCVEFREKYELFSDLWTKDLDTEFEAFTKDAVVRTERGAEMYDLDKYDQIITHYTTVHQQIEALQTPTTLIWLKVNSQPIKTALLKLAVMWREKFTTFLHSGLSGKLHTLEEFMVSTDEGLEIQVASVKDEANLVAVMERIRDVRLAAETTTESFGPLGDLSRLLVKHNIDVSDIEVADQNVGDYLEDAPNRWESVVSHTFQRKEEIMQLQQARQAMINEEKETFFLALRALRNEFREKAPFKFEGSPEEAWKMLDHYAAQVDTKREEAKKLNELGELFELSVTNYPEISDTASDLHLLKNLWDNKDLVRATHSSWKRALWAEIDTESLEDLNKQLIKDIRAKGTQDPTVKGWQVYRDLEQDAKNMQVVLPLVNALHSDAMRDRHWSALATVASVEEIDPHDKDFCLDDMLQLELHKFVDDVEEIVETATKELKIETKLKEIAANWNALELDFTPHKDSDVQIIKPSEDVIEALEANQLDLQTIIGMGKFVDYFRDKVMYWQAALGDVEEVLKDWVHVSKMWASLENIFLASADIRAQLPDDTKRFEGIDSDFKDIMKDAIGTPNVKDCTLVEGRQETLKDLGQRLELCQKSLNEYLDVKKKIFPRFYFVSNVALLEILSNGNNPPRIMPYIGDCYDSLSKLTQPEHDPEFCGTEEEPKNLWRTIGLEMVAKDGEQIPLPEPFEMTGAVEDWLNGLTEAMRSCLRAQLAEAVDRAQLWGDPSGEPRHRWLFRFPAQIVLNGTQGFWTEESEQALEELEGGSEESVKNYKALCDERLQHLIELVLGKLSKPDRTKIIALITLDVHARDVVQKLVDEKAESTQAFLWQQQLRFYYQPTTTDVDIKICDYRCKYFYEWIGNTGRLVITPLTDRCYITLTMALRLYLGGAPAGPAGTGKTETTKDLARCIALPCYVFNCSDQMNFESLADIFRGLCQAGAWGCFDEFNRISIEVLSVVASQVKTVEDAIVYFSVPSNREEQYQHLPAGTPPSVVGTFAFMGDTISLIPTCGMWITMNPGYAGRSELPENLKVLFRSCAMIRPDLKPICENMLMAEGFQNARSLAVKFVTLYELSSQLLSKQYHYDWGLRAVKSVLRVAGGMKREAPDLLEDKVLMRALRDFNTPKIPDFDTPIFMRLIADLFIGLEVPMQLNPTLAEKATRVAVEMGLQPDDAYVLKVVQFQELLDVRHSVFILGPAGCGKTSIWKGLVNCNNLCDGWKEKEGKDCYRKKDVCVYEQVNPKSVITDELYGYMTLSKDWKDGCLSIIMRGMSKNLEEQGFKESQVHKWVILDGDIDALWIESMNTVMDDNKVLTLVSNERVPLTAAMRMCFEINSLKNASPATVSRAGILFINEADIGWRPFVESWAAARDNIDEQSAIPLLFDKYVPPILDFSRKFKKSTPVRLICQVMTVCHLLEKLLTGDKECIEPLFVFCTTWAFGGPLSVDKQNDFRKEFHNQFTGTFTDIAHLYPQDGLCFDYYFDTASHSFHPWNERVAGYEPRPIGSGPGQSPFASIVVATMDTTRMRFLLDCLASNGYGSMLVGGAGTGKTTIVQDYLHSTDENTHGKYISMNYYTDSANLQQQIEANLEKRSGRTFGPKPGQKIIYFIDDMNLPFVETYGTQNAMALLHQHMDHGTIFDRADLGIRKEIVDVHYMAAMNPTSGSFFICERNQRKFATFTCTMPDNSDLHRIYEQVMAGHLSNFNKKCQKIVTGLVEATLMLHSDITNKFLPSAIKFVYNWNMRELRNIFQGLSLAQPHAFTDQIKLQRLWVHECNRVFCDRLMNETEMATYNEMINAAAKAQFEADDLAKTFEEPMIFTKFAMQVDGQDAYVDVPTMDKLNQVLTDKLHEHNESNPIMDLVLFAQAMEHVTRICRIISNPSGNAMLIGVGGSGKQSLTKLSAFICDMEVKQLNVTANFKVDDLKEYLMDLYKLAGIKNIPLVFIFTDSQIVNEKFLVYINNILASGWVPDLFPKDEMETIYSGVRNEAKANNVPDTPENLLEFFIERVKANLHIVLCFSPVGEIFRVRARRFPGLINCTAIDRFHPWPRDALVKVGRRFLEDVDVGSKEKSDKLAEHMAMVHLSVSSASVDFRRVARRHNHVTPKSFLELISFFKTLLAEKRDEVHHAIDRLDVGLSTIRHTSEDVAELQVDLEHTMVKVAEKVEATDVLIEEMGKQRAAAEVKQAAATIEEEKATVAANAAEKIETQAEKELGAAKPAMEAAAAAVDVLSKNMLGELKGLNKPPAGVDRVTTCCLIMIEKEFKNHKWDRAKKMMAQVDQFKQKLQAYDGRTIPEDIIKKIAPIVEDEEFTPEFFATKSAAAANLATWIVNIYGFNRIYVKVKPLMDSLAEAQASKAAADSAKAAAQAEVAEVQAQLQELEETFKQATAEKQEVEEQAAACNARLDLANRLVGGLSSENERWGKEIDTLNIKLSLLVGDSMLAGAFVSYIGAFNSEFRVRLWKEVWLADLTEKQIQTTDGVDPLTMITTEAASAQMMSEGLPSDRVSLESGAIVTSCKRWPLIIDPQQQAIKWLRKRFEGKERKLDVLQLTQPRWLNRMGAAIQNGFIVVIENVTEDIDSTLDPVLARAVYRKGRSYYLRLGGEEVDYDLHFKLFLQTKLSNPHFPPETLAQCTLVNFIATEQGLEEQLLALAVKLEQPELEEKKQGIVAAFQQYKIKLHELEDNLLDKLANAPDDILSDVSLIEGLEATKLAVTEINEAVEAGHHTEIEINKAREVYRPVAYEGSMLYFMLTQLCVVQHMYQYSLDAFLLYFTRALQRTEAHQDLLKHVAALGASLRLTIFTWVSRGLFEQHKLIFLALLTFNLIKRGKLEDLEISSEYFNFLMRCPRKVGESKPEALSWLPDANFLAAQALCDQEGFATFGSDLVEAAPRFREWYNHVTSETEKLPVDWAALEKEPIKKMLVVRCLRPDRMRIMLNNFVETVLPNGKAYTQCDGTLNSLDILDQSYADSSPVTPLFFILSPGADVVAAVDKLATKEGLEKGISYHNVSMGQGQDVVAMERLEQSHRNGHWVILNNIHLMPRWCTELEKQLDANALDGPHQRARLFLTSDPSPAIPIGILNRCIKLTNEPPGGLKANLKRAWCSFNKEYIDEADSKTRTILFTLCVFHGVLMERKLYGPLGYNMQYPFSLGDLRDSAVCLNNYMEANAGGKIPWADLRYIFGEIMYGGHIVNDFDRLLANTYLRWYMKDELLDETELFPYIDEKGVSFKSPQAPSFSQGLEHIEEALTQDTPLAFGLHPNAEIDFRTTQSDTLFATLVDLQPQDHAGGESGQSPQSVA